MDRQIRQGVELVLISGASAIVDRRDIVPAGIERAGGELLHFGMPVDPGNLLLLARMGEVPVLGLPGCARSPKTTGFDWVLQRLIADVPVRREDIMRMGAGGLLIESGVRPLPRAEAVEQASPPRVPKIAALVLAGRSTRMGDRNKLLEQFDGKPLVLHAVEAALASQAESTLVVTGHQQEAVESYFRRAGPDRSQSELRARAEHFTARWAVCIAGGRGRRGCPVGRYAEGQCRDHRSADRRLRPGGGAQHLPANARGSSRQSVLFARRYFPEVMAIAGDLGARPLLGTYLTRSRKSHAR